MNQTHLKALNGALLSSLVLATSCSNDDVLPSNRVLEKDEIHYLSVSISSVPTYGSRAENDYTYGDGYTGITAPGFEQGETSESEVKNAYFIFFDDNGNYIAAQNVPVGDLKLNDAYDVNGSIRKSYDGVVAVELNKGQTLPTQMMCFINPVSPLGLHKTLIELETTPRDSFYGQGVAANGFSMSNAVYYSSASGNPLMRAVEITGDQIFDSVEKAQAALNGGSTSGGSTEDTDNEENTPPAAQTSDSKPGVVTVYVERYASKVKFSIAEINNKIPLTVAGETTNSGTTENDSETTETETPGTETTETAPYSVKFVPISWAVNATDLTTFVSKSFRQTAPAGGIAGSNFNYADLNVFLTETEGHTNWLWNDPDNYRSYWGCSPAYYATEYPEVATDVNADSPLNYVVPNNMTKNFNSEGALIPSTGNSYGIEYVMESTIGREVIGKNSDSNNPGAAVPSIALYGQYEFYGGDEVKKNADNTNLTFYTVGSEENRQVYFAPDATTGESAAGFGQSILQYLLGTNPGLFLRVINPAEGSSLTKGQYVDLTPAAAMKFGSIVHPTQDVLTAEDDGTVTKLAADRVCYQVDENNAESSSENGTYFIYTDAAGNEYSLCVINAKDGNYYEVGTGTYTVNLGNNATAERERKTVLQTNQQIVQFRGNTMPVVYNQGMAWYNMPIYHLGWYVGENPNKTAKYDDIDFTKARVGDFGLVRNHVYHIDVQAINGLGIGINDPSTPLVPPSETETKAAAYTLKIENWAVVPVQSMEL